MLFRSGGGGLAYGPGLGVNGGGDGSSTGDGQPGTPNTGGGGGGCYNTYNSGAGGSGAVLLYLITTELTINENININGYAYIGGELFVNQVVTTTNAVHTNAQITNAQITNANITTGNITNLTTSNVINYSPSPGIFPICLCKGLWNGTSEIGRAHV